jgi:hypothetical protein
LDIPPLPLTISCVPAGEVIIPTLDKSTLKYVCPSPVKYTIILSHEIK